MTDSQQSEVVCQAFLWGGSVSFKAKHVWCNCIISIDILGLWLCDNFSSEVLKILSEMSWVLGRRGNFSWSYCFEAWDFQNSTTQSMRFVFSLIALWGSLKICLQQDTLGFNFSGAPSSEALNQCLDSLWSLRLSLSLVGEAVLLQCHGWIQLVPQSWSN